MTDTPTPADVARLTEERDSAYISAHQSTYVSGRVAAHRESLRHWREDIARNVPELHPAVIAHSCDAIADALEMNMEEVGRLRAALHEARAALAAEKERGDTIMIGYHAALARAEAAEGATKAAVEAEREACAVKCDRLVAYYQGHGGVLSDAASMGCQDCAAAVRGTLHWPNAGFVNSARAAGEEKP